MLADCPMETTTSRGAMKYAGGRLARKVVSDCSRLEGRRVHVFKGSSGRGLPQSPAERIERARERERRRPEADYRLNVPLDLVSGGHVPGALGAVKGAFRGIKGARRARASAMCRRPPSRAGRVTMHRRLPERSDPPAAFTDLQTVIEGPGEPLDGAAGSCLPGDDDRGTREAVDVAVGVAPPWEDGGREGTGGERGRSLAHAAGKAWPAPVRDRPRWWRVGGEIRCR